MRTKQLLLGAAFALTSTLSFAQPSEVTDAAMSFNAGVSAFYTGKMERYVEKMVEAKNSIDVAKDMESGKTHPKTYQYLAQIDMEITMAMAIAEQMKIDNAELKVIKDNSDGLGDEIKMAYDKCKALDDRKKRHIKPLNEYLAGKLGELNNQARMAFNMKMYDGAFGAFVYCASIAKMIGNEDSVGLDKNALVCFNKYADTIKITKKYEEALPFMEMANKTYSDNDYIVETYVNTLIELGKKDDAAKVMADAAKNNPNNINILYNIGIIYDAHYPNSMDGIKILKQGVIDNPESEYLNYITGISIYNNGSIIFKEFRATEDTAPNKASLKEEYTRIFTEAVPYFEKAMEKYPSKKKVAKNLYKCYQVTGDTAKADEMKAIFMSK
jgi:tetratricopeptide (TPR) repeat protein